MKSYALAALAAVGAYASPAGTKTENQLASRADSLPAISASGNAFWAGKERFYVRGIDYQPGGSSLMADPLADTDICMRDIKMFKKLGINTIRVYTVDNSMDHDECMEALAEAGIYLILDVNSPLYSINRADPHQSYNDAYLQSVFATIDAFIKYDNTMAFFSGNEVIHDKVNTTKAAPYVKATTRDMRQYIRSRGYRWAPVGYSAADVTQNRMQLAQYMNCGPEDERSDFFAFNDYSWCTSDFQTAGWDQKVQNFTDYGIPIFLSEYGCTKNTRDFGEMEALMSDKMTGVYSGGLMYEYSVEEGKDYGIVELDGDETKETDEFEAFAKALSKWPAPTGTAGAMTESATQACPTQDDHWLVDTTLLPAIPEKAKSFMKNGAGKAPGLVQPGSQQADGTSTGYASPGSGESSGTPTGSAGGSGSGSGSDDSGDNQGAAGGLGPLDKTPLYISGLTFFLTLMGTLLL